MAKIKKKVSKAKKKFWFQIVAPKMFGGQVIGESYVSDAQLMKGRNVTVNLRTLTDDIKNQNIKISLVVDNVKENKAHCSIIGFNLLSSAVKRMTSKGKVRIDDFIVCKTSDDIKIRSKIVMVTVNLTSNSVATHMRKKSRELLKEHIGKSTYNQLLEDLIAHKLQYHLKKELKKIYPLRGCEIRSFVIESKNKVEEEAPKKEEKKSKKEEKTEAEKKVKEKPAEEKKEEKVEEKPVEAKEKEKSTEEKKTKSKKSKKENKKE